MNQEVQDRITYHVEALKVSNEKAKADIEWLESRKNYRPSVKCMLLMEDGVYNNMDLIHTENDNGRKTNHK